MPKKHVQMTKKHLHDSIGSQVSQILLNLVVRVNIYNTV